MRESTLKAQFDRDYRGVTSLVESTGESPAETAQIHLHFHKIYCLRSFRITLIFKIPFFSSQLMKIFPHSFYPSHARLYRFQTTASHRVSATTERDCVGWAFR
jgi:hypothetical protein